MKLKQLKLLTAALVLATSGSAHAIIWDGLANLGGVGNGELFMTLWDVKGEKSYIRDFNIQMNTFLAGVANGQEWYFSADDTMIQFLGMVDDARKPRMRYVIAAADSSGANALDYHRYITTASEIDVTQPKKNFDIREFGSRVNIFLGDANSTLLDKQSEIVTDPTRLGYAGSPLWEDDWGDVANFTATGEFGTSMNIYLIRQSNGLFQRRHDPGVYELLTYKGLPYQATLDTAGNMRIAPVPEPETYALMLAGLGLVGWMARRRKAV